MKSQVLHSVIYLVDLQEKFEIDHSWEFFQNEKACFLWGSPPTCLKCVQFWTKSLSFSSFSYYTFHCSAKQYSSLISCRGCSKNFVYCRQPRGLGNRGYEVERTYWATRKSWLTYLTNGNYPDKCSSDWRTTLLSFCPKNSACVYDRTLLPSPRRL